MAFISDVTALSGTTPSVSFTGGDVYTITLSGNTTFTFSSAPPSGQAANVTVIVTQAAAANYSVTWPGTVKWHSGVSHSMSGNFSSVDIVSFTTTDGGATYYGFVSGVGMS